MDQTLWGEIEDEMYEEVAPAEDSDEEEEEEGAEKGAGAEGAEGADENVDMAEDTGLKTPGEGLLVHYFSLMFIKVVDI